MDQVKIIPPENPLSDLEFAEYFPSFAAQAAQLANMKPEERAQLNPVRAYKDLEQAGRTDLINLGQESLDKLRIFLEREGIKIYMAKLGELKSMLSAVSEQSSATSGQVEAVVSDLPLFNTTNGNGKR